MIGAVVDKSSWSDGPWQAEPDRLEWRYAGFPCLARRVPDSGHWCGYVGVPPEHPLYGKHYFDVPDLHVHGGLSYARACGGEICHIPEPEEPEHAWWFGFDCLHAGDLAPGMRFSIGTGIYRTLDYVKTETESLARQLKELAQ